MHLTTGKKITTSARILVRAEPEFYLQFTVLNSDAAPDSADHPRHRRGRPEAARTRTPERFHARRARTRLSALIEFHRAGHRKKDQFINFLPALLPPPSR